MSNKVQVLIEREQQRQESELSLIASENYVSKPVLEATGSVFTNKYAEGYPGRRYYAGNRVVDELETFAQQQAKLAFDTDYHVNVQPYSGSPANLAAYSAVLKPGDTVLSMSLAHGGHLTHGHSVSFTSSIYHFVHYGVDSESELIDYDAVQALAKEHRPKLIVCGATAYPMHIDFARFARIAREVGAWLMVDMAHISGLIAGGAYPTPFGHADIVTTSTHKTLRGPRGGMIFSRKEFAKAVDKAVFPGLQGGPHMNTIAALAIALQEAQTPAFQVYADQVVKNAKTMAYRLQTRGLRLVADGTESHLLLLDLKGTGFDGVAAQDLLEAAGIVCNKNALPFDTNPPSNPSGLRFGTAGITTRGLKEAEADQLGNLIADLLFNVQSPLRAQDEVRSLTKRFRIPAYF